MKAKAVNLRYQSCTVYVARPSSWGNPFTHRGGTLGEVIVASRAEAIQRYGEWLLLEQPELVERARRELKGQVLGCYCLPRACHAELLAEVAEATDDQIERMREAAAARVRLRAAAEPAQGDLFAE